MAQEEATDIVRYSVDGSMVRYQVEDESVEYEWERGWGEVPDFPLHGIIFRAVGLVETDMDMFGNGNAMSVLFRREGEGKDMLPWGLLQSRTSAVVRKVLGAIRDKQMPLKGRLVKRASGKHVGQMYWDLINPNEPWEDNAKKK